MLSESDALLFILIRSSCVISYVLNRILQLGQEYLRLRAFPFLIGLELITIALLPHLGHFI